MAILQHRSTPRAKLPVRRLLALATMIGVMPAVVFLTLRQASPAAAGEPPQVGWQPLEVNAENWPCERHDWPDVPPGYTTRICIVVNGKNTQTAIIVDNYTSERWNTEAESMDLWVDGHLIYKRMCTMTFLDHGSWVCFGPTTRRECSSHVQTFGSLIVRTWGPPPANLKHHAYSPTQKMCT
jgi:hypothetical protein